MSTVKVTSNVKRRLGKERTNVDVRYLVITAMLAAVSTVLMLYFEFPVPFMPTFIKFDFSDLPALIASFALGPVAGVLVCLVKNLFNLMSSFTAGVGELCNFLLSATFVFTAGIIYRTKKTYLLAIIGACVGSIAMALMSLPINYFIVYPVYTNIMPMETILNAYQAIFSGIKNLMQALVIFNLPFTLVKGLVNAGLAILIYKPLAPIIHGRN